MTATEEKYRQLKYRLRYVLESITGFREIKLPTGIVLPEFETVYWEVPKAGSSTIVSALIEVVHVEPHPSGNPHWAEWEKISPDQAYRYGGYSHLAIVRNPMARLESFYKHQIARHIFRPKELGFGAKGYYYKGIRAKLHKFGVFHKDMTFEQFVEAVVSIPAEHADRHLRPQFNLLCTSEGELAPEQIFKLEDNGVQKLLDCIGIDYNPKKLNTTGSANLELSPATEEKIRRYYCRDYEVFQY